MSIKTGLIRKIELQSSNANQINNIINKTEYSQKISSVFRSSGGYSCYSSRYAQSSSYPMKNVNINLSLKELYTYSIISKDSVTGEIIDPNNLNFEITTTNGNYSFSIVKNEKSCDVIFNNLPSNKNIKITARVTGDNYLETFTQIFSESEVYYHSQEIILVNLNNIPQGVGVASATINQNEDGTTQTNVVEIPSSESKYEQASFEIPSGTKFYDKDGNALTGNIDIKIGHFSPTNQTSLDMFNPGWSVSSVILDGKALNDNQSIDFISAGFFVIDIKDDSGTPVNNIGSDVPPIKGETSISPDLINPETGSPFVVGDTMPYWRINEDGLWEIHDTAVVVDKEGVLFMQFNISKFSWANLDGPGGCAGQARTGITVTTSYVTITKGNQIRTFNIV